MLLVWICFHVLVAIAFQNSENRVPELAFQNSEYCASGDLKTYPPCPFVIYKRRPTLSVPLNSDSVNIILESGEAPSYRRPPPRRCYQHFCISTSVPVFGNNGTLTIIPKPLASGYTVMRVAWLCRGEKKEMEKKELPNNPDTRPSTSKSHTPTHHTHKLLVYWHRLCL